MKNRNGLIILCSVIVGICAAVAATLVVMNYLKKKKAELQSTNLVFENDFEDEPEQQEIEE